MSWFRIMCGLVCVLLSVIFLTANTAILARYGWRSGTDEFEQLVNATVGGSVPLALAMMPFFIMVTWRPGHFALIRGKQKWRRGRPNPMVIVGFALYIVFVAFNFMGAIGSIALQKTEYVDKREGNIDESHRWRDAKARKLAELKQLQVIRPATAVRADLDGAKVHRFWKQTDGCAEGEATSRGHSKFCGSVFGWKQELGTAERADKLRAEIDDLDARLSSPSAKIATADPQSETLASYASLIMQAPVTAKQVRVAQPLIWFLLLELSCMFMFFMSLKFFRLRHTDLADHPFEFIPLGRQLPSPARTSRLVSDSAQDAQISAPGAIFGLLGGEDPELQIAVYDRFWADCTRRLPGGKETAQTVYSAYRAYCARPENGVQPFAFAEFARRAGDRVERTSTIGTTTWLCGFVLSEPMGAV